MLDLLTINKEFYSMSKELKASIKHMPRYYRYNAGDRIINLLLDLKIVLRLSLQGKNKQPVFNTKKLYNELIVLQVLIEDCVEDSALVFKGKWTIHQPYNRLIELLKLCSQDITANEESKA